MKKIPLLQLLKTRFPDVPHKELYARILCGEVAVDGEHHRNPQMQVSVEAELELEQRKYVSRGGLKLEAAITKWKLPVEGRVFLDAGASTGGFTDCLLQHGARIVHAVDVGYNQLDYSLRSDDRVKVAERTNIMHVQALDPSADAAVADLSFRSLRGAAAHIIGLTGEKWMVGLLKPQFELEGIPDPADAADDFNGVVRVEQAQHILEKVVNFLRDEGLRVEAISESPIVGRKGNREFLLLLTGAACKVFAGQRFADENPFAG
ncbi:MAG: TlyA family RNA methyltransferase [Spirochaetota bacterium]